MSSLETADWTAALPVMPGVPPNIRKGPAMNTDKKLGVTRNEAIFHGFASNLCGSNGSGGLNGAEADERNETHGMQKRHGRRQTVAVDPLMHRSKVAQMLSSTEPVGGVKTGWTNLSVFCLTTTSLI